MKNIAADFDSVGDGPPAEEGMDADDDEELVPEAPQQAAQVNPPETYAPDFWSTMKVMLDDQRAGTMRDLREKMQAQEQRLGTRIDLEKHERTKDKEQTDLKLAEITERLKQLETRPTTPAAIGGSSWTAKFVILGEWNPQTPKETIETDIDKWWATLPASIQNTVQKPWVPRRYCAIAKARPAENMMAKAAFELQKHLQERPAGAGPPRWAMIERSPETGQFKRRVRLAAAEVAKLGEGWEVDAANGAVYFHRAIVARMVRPANNWERTAAWAMVQTIPWENFRDGLERATKE